MVALLEHLGGSYMKRREFLAAGTAASATMLAAPAIAQSSPKINWRLASAFPSSLDTLYGTAKYISERVAEATDNEFQIQTFAAGEIVPGGGAVIDAVESGTVECCHTCSYYALGKDPVFAFGTCMPFGLNSRQADAWLRFGGGQEQLNEFYKDYNLHAFTAGNTGVQMGGWFRKELKTVEDLRGIKFRVGGLAGTILTKLGVVPQQLAGGDVYPSLEKGVIDAAEWTGPYDDEKLGLYKVAKNYYFPGWWDQGTAISLMINKEQWDSLPKKYQAVLAAVSGDANTWMQAKYDHENPLALRRLIEAGAQLRAFPEEIMQACFNATNETYAEISSGNETFAKLLESMMSYRDAASLWWQVSELPYDIAIARAGAARP